MGHEQLPTLTSAVTAHVALEQVDEPGPFSDDGYAVGHALGSVVLPEPSGEEESVLDRLQVLEDVEAIIHEVRHPQVLAHWMLLRPLAHEMDIPGADALRADDVTRAQPAASELRNLRTRLRDDVNAVLEEQHQAGDRLERSRNSGRVHRSFTEERSVRALSNSIDKHSTDIETENGLPRQAARRYRIAAQTPLLR